MTRRDLHVLVYAPRHFLLTADSVQRSWPWAADLATAFDRLRALPA